MNKILTSAMFLLSVCGASLGQTAYRGLTPGQSTRADAERVLGQPVKEVSETLVGYKSTEQAEQIFVQYRRGSSVVERIEVIYAEAAERETVLRALRLPPRPAASRTNAKGRLEEYFSSKDVVLTYEGADATSGVRQVGYYSRELFESAAAKASGRSQAEDSGSATKDSRTEIGASLGAIIRGIESDGKGAALGAIIDPRATEGRARQVEQDSKRLSGQLDELAAMTRPDEREVPLSATDLRRLIGRYEFVSSPDDSFTEWAVMLEGGGMLKLRAGSAFYALVPTGVSKINVVGQGQGQSDQFNFKIKDRPGAVIRFTVSEGKVREMLFAEEKGGEMIIAVAVPKP